MPIPSAIDADNLSSSLQLWALLGPLVGVIAGGVLGGLFQIFLSQRRFSFANAQDLAHVRRDEYFAALDAAYSVDRSMNKLAGSASGRWEPGEDDHSEEAERMREMDRNGAEAMNDVVNAFEELDRVKLRVEAVANPRVSEAMSALVESAVSYIMALDPEGKFSAAAYAEFRAGFESKRALLASAVRSDLAIDRRYKAPKK